MSHLQQTENGVRKGLAVTHVQLSKGIELAPSKGTLQHSLTNNFDPKRPKVPGEISCKTSGSIKHKMVLEKDWL